MPVRSRRTSSRHPAAPLDFANEPENKPENRLEQGRQAALLDDKIQATKPSKAAEEEGDLSNTSLPTPPEPPSPSPEGSSHEGSSHEGSSHEGSSHEAPHTPATLGRLSAWRALRTFVLEVSAGRESGAGEVSSPQAASLATLSSPVAGQPPTASASDAPGPTTLLSAASSQPAERTAAERTAGGRTTQPSGKPQPAAPRERDPEPGRKSPGQFQSQPPGQAGGQARGQVGGHRGATAGKQLGDPAGAKVGGQAGPKVGGRTPDKQGGHELAGLTGARRGARRTEEPRAQPSVPARRKLPSWVASLAAHGVLLVALSLCSLASRGPELDFSLLSSSATVEPLESFAELEFDAVETLEEISDETPAELIDPGLSSARELTAASDAAELAGEVGAAAESLAAASSLFGGPGGGLSSFGSGLGGAATSSFFGAKLEGRRICFVLDNSGSMQGERLETVLAELDRSVAALRPEQHFYVLFYSDDVYPLFYPDPAPNFVPPTDATREALTRWLTTIELCYGDVIDEALGAAIAIEPDTMFLLSDGKITSQRDLQLLRAPDKPFPIHTFGVGLGNAVAAREKLQAIADANGGEFRETEIDEAQREVARSEPRVYHRTAPGPIWGRRVRPPR